MFISYDHVAVDLVNCPYQSMDDKGASSLRYVLAYFVLFGLFIYTAWYIIALLNIFEKKYTTLSSLFDLYHIIQKKKYRIRLYYLHSHIVRK